MDTRDAGKMTYPVLLKKYGSDYMKKLSKLGVKAREKRKNEAKIGAWQTEASMLMLFNELHQKHQKDVRLLHEAGKQSREGL